MPMYEYVCQNCATEIEKLQKINATPLCDCPACGQPSLRRKISAVGFQLKGTGWYVTDFKNKPQASTAKAGDSKEEKSETTIPPTTTVSTETT